MPLTGAAALRAGQNWDLDDWLPAFLRAIEPRGGGRPASALDLERAWFAARHSIAGRRRDSHVAAAVDCWRRHRCSPPPRSPASSGIAVKNAIRICSTALCRQGSAIEVTHRSKRRLFGLAGLAPLRQVVHPPYRTDPNRGPDRPRHDIAEEAEAAPPPLPPLTPIERRDFDYTTLEEAMAHLDAVVRSSRQALHAIMVETARNGAEATSDY